MMKRILTARFTRLALGCLAALLVALNVTAAAQDQSAQSKGEDDGKNIIKVVPVPKLLADHSKWFDPEKIYHLRTDHFPLKDYPQGLGYDIYSAVGYDLANTIVIKSPPNRDGKHEYVIVDTLGNPGITSQVIKEFRKQGVFPSEGPIPIRAIIYTHNHIDHTFGVWGYLREADRPPCGIENPEKPGPDGYFNVDKFDKDNGCVTVIGQYKINEGVATTALITGTIIDARSSYMYGAFIPRNQVNDGIGPQEYSFNKKVEIDGKEKRIPIQGSYRMPSRTFNEELHITAAGVQMKIIYVPSETNDELAIFLPDRLNKGGNPAVSDLNSDNWRGQGLLLSAEVIQGPSFPNLYSLRGTSYRNPATWFRSVDKLRQFDSWCMVPSHGPPVCEAENIQRLLRNFRDGVQFTHDQTIRWMNKGYTMDELAPLIEGLYLGKGQHEVLMDDLEKVQPIQNKDGRVVHPRDYLRPFYGSVVQGVREIYAGSVGWFQADPVALKPTLPHEIAKRTVKLMGGASAVNQAARQALDNGDAQWAAELTTNVVRAFVTPNELLEQSKDGKGKRDEASPGDIDKAQFWEARRIKAEAFLKIAETEINPNWRNWYITSAHELKGLPLPDKIVGGLVSPGVIGALPAGGWVSSLSLRLKAEITAPIRLEKSFGFWFPAETNQGFGAMGYIVQIRNGIAEFIEETAQGKKLTRQDVEKADLAILLEKKALDELLIAEARPDESLYRKVFMLLVEKGDIKALGKTRLEDFIADFIKYFDPKPVGLPPLTVR